MVVRHDTHNLNVQSVPSVHNLNVQSVPSVLHIGDSFFSVCVLGYMFLGFITEWIFQVCIASLTKLPLLA